MPNFNTVILIGHVTRDVDGRYLPDGKAIAKSGIAVSRKWGEKEETLFIDWVAFGKTAEVIIDYVKKGSALLIQGRLKLDQWENKEGEKRSKHNIIVETFQFLG